MTIAEKILESAEINTFTLFKEGLFYKCYNEDAMVFAKHVKPYKVSTKYVKNIGADVLSLGFPASEAEKGKLAFDIISEKLGAVKFDAGSDKVTFSLKENLTPLRSRAIVSRGYQAKNRIYFLTKFSVTATISIPCARTCVAAE